MKIGKRRETGDVCFKKLEEAKIILKKFEDELVVLSSEVKQLSDKDLVLINNYKENIEKIFKEVIKLCTEPKVSKKKIRIVSRVNLSRVVKYHIVLLWM